MTKFLLTLHVLAAVVAVGPVAVAASMFPPAARRAGEEESAVGTVRLLHRICRIYSGVGVAVPALGFATASAMGVLASGWLIASITVTAVAAGVLIAFVLPRQDELLGQLDTQGAVERSSTVRLAMFTGVFNLLWAAVTVLMIVRPGSSTGA